MIVATDKLAAFVKSTSTEPVLANAFDLWNVENSLIALHTILVGHNQERFEGITNINMEGTFHGIEAILTQIANNLSEIVTEGMENFQNIVVKE